MATSTLRDGTKTAKYMPMTSQPLLCSPPLLPEDLDSCGVPGGNALWSEGGFYSPGQCFIGYIAMCTQTSADNGGWPIRPEETAVRCIPSGYKCNDEVNDQRYATSMYDGTTLSAPAFEIRWRSDDVRGPGAVPPATSMQKSTAPTQDTTPVSSSSASGNSVQDTRVNEGSQNMKKDNPGLVAGIVIGSILGCCLILVGTFMFWRRRRRSLAKSPGSFGTTPDNDPLGQKQDSIAELHDRDVGPRELAADSQLSNGVVHSHISLTKSPVELSAS